MKIVPIPQATLAASKKVDRELKDKPWWRVPHDQIPGQGIHALSTGGGEVKAGTVIYLIGGHNRTVYPDAHSGAPLVVHEFVGIVHDTGWQPLLQLGRDCNML